MGKKQLAMFLFAMVVGSSWADTPKVDAASSDASSAIRESFERLDLGGTVDAVEESPIPGLYQVELSGGRLFYATPDGQLVIAGAIFDVTGERPLNLTAQAEARGVARALEAMPMEELIIFAPAEPKTHVTIFTDVDCGYCRKLHLEMEELNALGVEVRYAAFPRGGLTNETAATMESIWCARDPRDAMTRAKTGKRVRAATCENPIAAQFDLGRQIGVQGTPAIFLANGRLIPGYQPAAQLAEEALSGR